MKSRDVVIGFIFLVILIAGVLWIFKARGSKTSTAPIPTPNITQKVNNAFPALVIPAGADRADLSDVTGGSGVGVASRQNQNGKFTITVMANLPDGSYKASLSNGTSDILLGNMNLTKSGYLVNLVSYQDLSGYNKVIISSNSGNILEGSF